MGIHTDYRVEQRCRLGALSRLSQCSVEYSSLNDLISQLGGLLFAAGQYTLRMPHTEFGIFFAILTWLSIFSQIVYKFACSAFCLAKAVISQLENSQLRSWLSHAGRTECTGAWRILLLESVKATVEQCECRLASRTECFLLPWMVSADMLREC